VRHPHGDASDAGPRVEPEAQRPERQVVRGPGKPGEADSRTQELAALVEHALVDHLVRSRQDRLRNGKAERLRGLHIDHKLELRGLLDGEVGRLSTFEDLIHVGGNPPVEVGEVDAVRCQRAGFHELLQIVHRGQTVLTNQRGDFVSDR
jgi:hypothetical protein